MDSILTSTKKLLGIVETDTHFDEDIIMHINTAMVSLNQIGVGPTTGFSIEDDTEVWDDLLEDRSDDLQSVKSYIYLKVRLLFDPPANSFIVESMNRQIAEIEWRLNVQVETGQDEEVLA